MSFYLVAGHGASTAAPVPGGHLPTARRRVCPSDTSDTEWNLIAGLVPVGGPRPARGGRPCGIPGGTSSMRSATSPTTTASAGPCRSTSRTRSSSTTTSPSGPADGTLSRIHDTLREQVRVAEGRQPVLTAGLIDAQSLRTAETVGRPSRGLRRRQKNNGRRKRHIIVDTTGLLVAILVTAAHQQDRDGGRLLLQALRMCFPSIRLIWADQGYSGTLVTWAVTSLNITLQIVRKLADQTGFVVLHRRWAVERTFSWINRCRRTVREYERRPEHHAAMVQWAMVIITRRLARYTNRRQTKAT
jgi:transposase